MTTKQTWRMALLSAGLTAAMVCGSARAADDTTAPAKPAQTPAATTGRPRFDPAEMLKNYRDQFEGINLTDDQMKKIDGFLTTAESTIKPLLGKEDDDSRTQRREAFTKLREDTQAILTDTQKAALSAKRQQRMIDGFKKAFTNADLKLTDDQTTKVNAVLADVESQIKAIPAGGDERENGRKVFGIIRASREKLNAILTPEQQKLIPQFGGRRGGNRGTTPPAAPPAQ